MPPAALLVAAALAQTPNPLTDCSFAMSRSTSGATVQVCLAEAELGRALASAKDTTDRKRHMDAAVALYKKAFTLPAEETLLSARRLQPADIEPLKMLAQFYSRRAGAMHAARTRQEQESREQTPPGYRHRRSRAEIDSAPRRGSAEGSSRVAVRPDDRGWESGTGENDRDGQLQQKQVIIVSVS